MSSLIAAIDIGSNTVRVVAGEIRDEKIVLLARASAISAGVRGGFITNKTEALTAVKKAIRLTEKQVGQQITDIHLTAAGEPLVNTITSSTVAVSHGDGIVTHADVDNCLRRSIKKSLKTNQRNIDSIILSYALDGTETVSEPLGMHGKKLEIEAMLFNYASQNMDAAEDVLDLVDVSLSSLFPGVIASSIVSLSTVDRKVGCVLIDIGSDSTSYVVYEQDSPIHVGHLPTGSDSITQSIALEYQIPVKDAELLKQGGPLPSNISSSDIEASITKSLSQLFKQINTELKEIKKSANLPGGAVLCGGGALLPHIESTARDILKIPVRKASVRAFKKNNSDEKELTWASVYGTLIKAMEIERAHQGNFIARAVKKSWSTVRRYFA